MALIVQKYGGSSVANPECIQQVAGKVAHTCAEGHQVVVVVSAMYGETERLISLAKAIHTEVIPREYAALVATGEQVSSTLLAMALQARGYAARSFTGAQAHIITDNHYQKARILAVESQYLKAALEAGQIPVVAGFQGLTAEGDITTLGRGGSDTTAVALAAALKADECQIYTDVDGVYTADPRLVANAQRLAEISFPEMLEFASLGAKVLQQRAVEFAGQYRVPVRVLSTFQQGPGTLISFTESHKKYPAVVGIALSRQEAQLTLKDLPERQGLLNEVLTAMSAAALEIDMLIQQVSANDHVSLSFSLARDDLPKACAALGQQLPGLSISSELKLAKISLIGIGLRSHPGIISALFNTLNSHGMAARLVSTSENRISVLMDEQQAEQGLQLLHSAFGLQENLSI